MVLKKILILPEYWSPHMFSLIRGFKNYSPDGVEVFWTNRKWNREDFAVLESWDTPTYLPVDYAMKRLAETDFDAVVLSDGTMLGYMTAYLRNKTTRVFLDATDHRYAVESYLYFADVYLKAQHPLSEIQVGGSVDLTSAKPDIPIVSWPYCCGGQGEEVYRQDVEREPFVHFRGWGWPLRRVAMVESVIRAGIPMRGALYKRTDLIGDGSYMDCVKGDKLSFPEYVREMRSCLVALNPVGNGQICFRTMEIMRAGVAMVSQRLDVRFPGPAPVHGRDWIVVDTPDEAVEACRRLLEDPETALEIGANGRAYWEKYGTDEYAARRLVQLLGYDGATA